MTAESGTPARTASGTDLRRAALSRMGSFAPSAAPLQIPAALEPSQRDLAGCVAIVTGSGRGIGKEIVGALVARRCSVMCIDRDEGPSERDRPASLVGTVVADISQPSGVENAVASTLDRWGRIDILVNNAGIVHADPLLELPLETWQRVFRTNVEGTLLMSQRAATAMVRQQPNDTFGRRGTIVNVTSLAADWGRPLLAAYGASKAALNHLTQSFSESLRDELVSCFGVCPGNHREGMWGYLGPMIAMASGQDEGDIEREREFQSARVFADVVVDAVLVPDLALTNTIVLWDREITPI